MGREGGSRWAVGDGGRWAFKRLTVDGPTHGQPATGNGRPTTDSHRPRSTGSPAEDGLRTEAAGDLVPNFRERIPRLHQTEGQNGCGRSGEVGGQHSRPPRPASGGRGPLTLERGRRAACT